MALSTSDLFNREAYPGGWANDGVRVSGRSKLLPKRARQDYQGTINIFHLRSA
jgi:hypothetical protein